MADLLRPAGVDIYENRGSPRENANEQNKSDFLRGHSEESDNIFSNRSTNPIHNINKTQITGSRNETNQAMKDNSALDLMGLGVGEELDNFEEYGDESVKVKDTTFQSDM